MKMLQNIRLSFGFLILAGSPPYLAYDVHRMTQGEADLFHWFNLALAITAIIASTVWLLSLRGEDYLRLRSHWERVLALVVLIASSPVLFVTMTLIRIESAGRALYTQKRIGQNRRRKDRREADGSQKGEDPPDRRNSDRREENLGGEPFIIYKLRSMRQDAEKLSGAAWSTGERDPRVTAVGHVIRKTHLDEVPQFYNVLLGQMSVIGPRPERPNFIRKLSDEIEGYGDRLNAPPGITGLAQINQDADETIEDVRLKLRYDKEYIETACLFLDIKIVLQTIALIVSLFIDTFGGRVAERDDPKAADSLVPERVPVSRR